MKNVIKEVAHLGALDETLNQSLNCWSRSSAFMWVLPISSRLVVKKVINGPDFIMSITAFVRHRVISAVNDELKREAQVMKEILSVLYHFYQPLQWHRRTKSLEPDALVALPRTSQS